MKNRDIHLLIILFLVGITFFIFKPKIGFTNTIEVPLITKSEILNPIYNRFKSRFKKVDKGGNLSGIDAVYVITMPQRKKYITEQIEKLGINAIYLDAITPSDIKAQEYNTLTLINDPTSRIYLKYTRFAVLLSFIMCLMDSLVNGYSTIVIFEDDISTLVDSRLLNESTQEFKNNKQLDVFYMGYCYLQNCKQSTVQYKNLFKLSNPDLLCGHSMCLKRSVIPEMIDYCFPMTTNSDEMFRDFYKANGINVCVPKQVYFTQNRETNGSLNDSNDNDILFKTCQF